MLHLVDSNTKAKKHHKPSTILISLKTLIIQPFLLTFDCFSPTLLSISKLQDEFFVSPFSHYLHELRMQRNVRQADLAERMSYEQSYISALEVGTKGPPTPEFLARLAAVLLLSEDERKRLDLAVEASQRKVMIDADKPQEIFWMFKELRDQLDFLTSSQVRAALLHKYVREVIPQTPDGFMA